MIAKRMLLIGVRGWVLVECCECEMYGVKLVGEEVRAPREHCFCRLGEEVAESLSLES